MGKEMLGLVDQDQGHQQEMVGSMVQQYLWKEVVVPSVPRLGDAVVVPMVAVWGWSMSSSHDPTTYFPWLS